MTLVDEAVERLKSIPEAKGIMSFALVDRSGEVGKAGMKMRPTSIETSACRRGLGKSIAMTNPG